MEKQKELIILDAGIDPFSFNALRSPFITCLDKNNMFNDKTYLLNKTGLRNNNPKYLVVHATLSYPTFESLLNCHFERGWNGVGYHLFLASNNEVYKTRPFELEGAHSLGFNTQSLGFSVYAENARLNDKKIEKFKEVLEYLNKDQSFEIIPHTVAQLKYINSLFENYGIDKRFDESIEIINKNKFNETKKELDVLVGSLSTSIHANLKSSIKGFTNCPGELFYELMK